jgi:hypothetical protein
VVEQIRGGSPDLDLRPAVRERRRRRFRDRSYGLAAMIQLADQLQARLE